ncbi:tannase/feruloyl esterase family alpha/beta hydrolase [Phenylobacterium sp.]|jgi:feruloyl esterase|uniref:tannase/feruloyl esterase family alpha/beta hydrolase n=1 Tax=Phenylobacterium sp. TaxID=1871053 RepID=UPI002F954CC8
MKRLLFAAGAVVALAAPGLAHAETDCASLKQTRLDRAEVTAASVETAGGKQVCKVSVTSRPTSDSDIRIEVWIPLGQAWNGKFVQVGNGGFAGRVPSGQLRALAGQGYAAAGTDNGHQSNVVTSAAWALGHPEKFVDFGWRSIRETTVLGKAVLAAQKGQPHQKAYFMGCSDGGREALLNAQRFPNAFDGIVAGAPANYMSELFGFGAAHHQALSAPGGYLDAPKLQLLQKSVLAQCADGGPFVRDPASCRFDPRALQCRPGQDESQCLTPAQVRSATVLYGGRTDPRTRRIVFPGFTPGAEAAPGAWNGWITGPNQGAHSGATGYQFSSNAFKYFVFEDPTYDFLKLDLGRGFQRAKAKMSPIIDAESPNLRAFKARGGKLIQYHGWNDQGIPARSSIRYYEDVSRTMGRTDDFYRLYMIPGMLHCGGGPGPSNVDWLSVLDRWVTQNQAPADLTAAGANNASQLLCPYPGVARKSGEAWACAAPRRRS